MKIRATVTKALDAKHKEVEEKLVVIRVTYQRRNRQYSIGDDSIHLTPKEYLNKKLRRSKEAHELADKAVALAKEVIAELGSDFTFDSFREKYYRRLKGRKPISSSLDSLLSEYFNDPKHKSKYKTIKSYETSVNWVKRYRKNATLSSITPDFVDNLISFIEQTHLKEHGTAISQNTLNIYLRQLRAIYNFAIQKGYTNNTNPFSNRSLGSYKRIYAALSKEELKSLMSYTPKNKKEEMGKDFFMLSFYCNGANLGDILLFKNSYIKGNILYFERRKTKSTTRQSIEPIPVTLQPSLIALFNKYGKISEKSPDSLILPFLANAQSEGNLENRIKRVIRKVNAGLLSICGELGWRKITTYNARHTYATILRDEGMSIEQIQKLLGHSNILMTQNYLGYLSPAVLNKAQAIIKDLESGIDEA